MITGEERLREYLGRLYGDVNAYDGRPTASQLARADVLDRELTEVIKEFDELTKQRLPALNRDLRKKGLAPLSTISEQDWQKTTTSRSSSPSPEPSFETR
jgi:hypothetical protein